MFQDGGIYVPGSMMEGRARRGEGMPQLLQGSSPYIAMAKTQLYNHI